MGFQTYTCCICGKDGLTKRNSYLIEGKGRACREHEQSKNAFNKREADKKKKEILFNITNGNKEVAFQKYDERAEVNLLKNLKMITLSCHILNNEQQKDAVNKIFNSDEYINYFHPHFDEVVKSIDRNFNATENVDKIISNIDIQLDKIEADNNKIHDNYYDEFFKSIYKEIEQLFMFMSEDHREDEVRKCRYIQFYRTVGPLVSKYENSPMNGNIKNLNKLCAIAKMIVRNLFGKNRLKTDRFSKYDIDFADVLMMFNGLNDEK